MYSIKSNQTEEVFSQGVRADRLQDGHIAAYRTKTIKSGKILEYEVYPVWNTHAATRGAVSKESRPSQKRLNNVNATKHLTRLINQNFDDNGCWLTLTYSDASLPQSETGAHDNIVRYLRRLKYYIKRRNLPELKYVYVTEYNEGIRVHHHVVVNFYDRDILEKLWNGGGRTQARRLQADEMGYTGMATYISKDPKGRKRYGYSLNLEKYRVSFADTKITKNTAHRIATGRIDSVEYFERLARDYVFVTLQAKTSDFCTGCYLYAKMRLRT